MGEETRLAELVLGTVFLGAVLGPASGVSVSPLCPGLRSIDPELGRTGHHRQNASRAFLAQYPHLADLGHQDPERLSGLPWVAQPGRGTSAGGPQIPAPVPLWHSPQMPKEGWRVVGGPGARQQRPGGRADGPSRGHPLPPPTACTPAWLRAPNGLPSCRHIRPGPDINPHQGPLPLSFLPSSSLPNSRLFFLLSLFQHVITVETKSAGTMRALTAAPSRPPPGPLPPRCVPALFPPAQGWNRGQRSPANKQEEPDKPGTQ